METDIHFTTQIIIPPPLRAVSREVGACVEFLGIVREQEGVRSLAGLQYEAYETMARRAFAGIFAELALLHPCAATTVIHRLGWVPVGEAALFVRVQAKHRGPALALCGALIDRMKDEVPIWKRAV